MRRRYFTQSSVFTGRLPVIREEDRQADIYIPPAEPKDKPEWVCPEGHYRGTIMAEETRHACPICRQECVRG